MTTFLLRASGALPGGELWATGCHFEGVGTPADHFADMDTLAETLWNGDGGGVNGLTAHYPSTITLTSVVAYSLNVATGKVTARAESTYTYAGTALDDPLPQEVAVCATLRTATPGPAGRGRMFLPSPIVGDVTAVGRLSTAARLDFVQAVAAALTALHANLMTPVLFSVGRANRPINEAAVGDVFDAQRRRRDKLVEVRQTAAVG